MSNHMMAFKVGQTVRRSCPGVGIDEPGYVTGTVVEVVGADLVVRYDLGYRSGATMDRTLPAEKMEAVG